MKKQDYSFKQFINDYWMFLKGKRLRFGIYTALIATSNLMPFVIAYLLGQIIDFFTLYSKGEPLTDFYLYVGGIALAGSFQVWLRFFGKLRMQTIAANLRKEVRLTATTKLMDLELKWHEKEETGSKIQKINEGGENIYRGIKDFSNDGLYILTSVIGAFIIFFTLNINYFIYTSVYIAIYISGEYYFNKKLSYWRTEQNKIREKVSGKLHESASNLLTVKSLGLKEVFKKSTKTYETKYYDIWLNTRNISQRKSKTIKIFAALGYAGFLFLIGRDVVNGIITVGSIIVFAAYFNKLRGALDHLTNKSNDFIIVKSAVGRFMTIFGEEIFDREENLLRVPKNWKTINFDNVNFFYKKRLVLRNFSLTIYRNEKIGVVGKSGCGKSTLTRLLLGLYQPVSGRILIDGKNLTKFKHSSITNALSIVLQESEIFNLPLIDNITITSTKKDLKAYKKVKRIAQLNDLINRLPQKDYTVIGEKGYKVSGGERQRIGIARALYKDTPFIILDEATSSLDSKTEQKIQSAIERNLKNKTLLIIAHRFSTLKNVNRIVVMERGRIVEQGRFKQLIKKKGKFYQLYRLQKNK